MPVITNIEDLRQLARKKIPRAIFDYVDHGSYDEITFRANTEELKAIRFRQRVLIDASNRSLEDDHAGREGRDAGRHRADRADRPDAS